jgi:metallophosphoesterase superfamily enzyme
MVECHSKSRLFAISDIHIDYKENKSWLTDTLENGHFFNDGIIVAGDITHRLEVLEEFFVLLLGKFQDVFFVPGNHELWIFESDGAKTSIEKFNLIIDLCTRLGVHTTPKKVRQIVTFILLHFSSNCCFHLITFLFKDSSPILF